MGEPSTRKCTRTGLSIASACIRLRSTLSCKLLALMYAQRAWITPALLSSLILRMFPIRWKRLVAAGKRSYISYQVLGALETARGIAVGVE
jgi:hypothetical protein